MKTDGSNAQRRALVFEGAEHTKWYPVLMEILNDWVLESTASVALPKLTSEQRHYQAGALQNCRDLQAYFEALPRQLASRRAAEAAAVKRGARR